MNMAIENLEKKFQLKFNSMLLSIYQYIIDRKDINQHFEYIAKQISMQYKKPGFRKGHVPLSIIIQEKANDPSFYEDALDHLIKSDIGLFLMQNNIKLIKISYSRIIGNNIEIYVWKYPEKWDMEGKKITQYKVQIDTEEIEEKIQNELSIHLSKKEVTDRSVQVGDIIDIVHIMEGKEFAKKILVSDQHWSVNMKINEEYHSFINESVLEDLENNAREYFFSEKISIVKRIYENIKVQVNDDNAKKAGYEDLNDMRDKVKQLLEEESQVYSVMLLQKQSIEYLLDHMNDIIFDKNAIVNEFTLISSNLLKYLNTNDENDIDNICLKKFNMKFGDILLELEKFCNKKILIRHVLSLYNSYETGTFNIEQYNKNMHSTINESKILEEIVQLFSYEVKDVKYKELLEILDQNNKSDALSCLMEKK